MPWGRWDAPERGTCGSGVISRKGKCVLNESEAQKPKKSTEQDPPLSLMVKIDPRPYRWFLGPLGFNQAA